MRMKTKIFAFGIIILLALGNVVGLVATAEGNQPQWPTSWILADTDPNESGSSKDYRDVHYAYYYADNDYLYFRLECFGSPNFTTEPKSRYKWFIDTDDPHNMAWQGSNVYDAEFLLFVEKSSKLGGNVYLLHDTNGNGVISDDWHDYSSIPGPILDTSVAGYRIINHCIDIYIRQAEIGNPISPYFTWATDQEDPNLDSTSTTDRSDSYWNANLAKADLSIVISDSADPVHPGDPLTYTLQVTNHGPQDAVNVRIQDTLPDTVTFIHSVPAQNGITDQTVWWNFPSLAVGNSEIITINVTIKNNTAAGVITDIADAYSDTYDPLPGNNVASEDTTVLETDVEAPSTVTGLAVSDAKDGKLDLSWDAAIDNVGVDHYEIYRDGVLLLNVTGTSYQDSGLVNGQSYTYTVRAVDAAGNKGNFSNPVSGTPTKTSTPYTPSNNNPSQDENTAPITNASTGKTSLGIGNVTISFNASYSPFSQPIINGPAEGYTDIYYNFSIIVNNSNSDFNFMIDWGDGHINENDSLAADSYFTTHHKWIHPGEYTIIVTAFDGQTNATTSKTIKIYTPNTSGANIPESSNSLFILLALLALIFLLSYYLLRKRRKNEEEDK